MNVGDPFLILDLTHNLSQLSYVGIFLLLYTVQGNRYALLGIMLLCWLSAFITLLMVFDFHLVGINLGLDLVGVLMVSGLMAFILIVMSIKPLMVFLSIVLIVLGYLFPSIAIFLPKDGPASVPYPSYFQEHRTQGTTVVNDPLTQSSSSSWETSEGGNCHFSDPLYSVKTLAMNHFQGCYGPKTPFQDLTYEVKMTISSGDCGGLVFDDNTPHSAFYLFRVCQDGTYNLMSYTQGKGFWRILVGYPTSGEIAQGAGATNLIAILTQGSDIYFYINRVQIAEIHGTHYLGGSIGLGAYSRDENKISEVAYEDARVWVPDAQ